MDVTVPPELRERATTPRPETRRDPSNPRPSRSAAVRVGAIALVAAVSGAVAGAVVADHRGSRASASTSGSPAGVASVDVATLVAAVAPAVVSVRNRPAAVSNLFTSSVPAGVGTGTVIGSDGTILTAASLVSGDRPITVTLADGRSLRARVVGRDETAGVAVLHVAATGLPVAHLAADNRLRVGDDVVALADALSFPGGPTASRGVVAALSRAAETRGGQRLTNLLEVTTPLGAANVGGPVIDALGEIVGVAVPAPPAQPATGFAIDVARAGPVIDALERGQAGADALGAGTIDVTPVLARAYGLAVESGALVASIVPRSPAAAAGLRPDDIVVGLDRQRIATSEDLVRGARDLSVASARLSVLRGRQPLTLTVRLAH